MHSKVICVWYTCLDYEWSEVFIINTPSRNLKMILQSVEISYLMTTLLNKNNEMRKSRTNTCDNIHGYLRFIVSRNSSNSRILKTIACAIYIGSQEHTKVWKKKTIFPLSGRNRHDFKTHTEAHLSSLPVTHTLQVDTIRLTIY